MPSVKESVSIGDPGVDQGPFSHLCANKSVSLVAAQHVQIFAVDMPVRGTRRQLEALPFALEDALGASIDGLHFALCGPAPGGKVLAAAVGQEVLNQHIAAHPDTPVFPEQMILAPAQADPENGPVWRAYRKGDRVLIRASDGTGFAARSDMLARMWHIAGRPKIESYGAPLEAELKATDLSAHNLPVTSLKMIADLRQGALQPPRGLARPMKLMAASIVLAALVHLAIAALDVQAQTRVADSLRSDAATALAQRLPNASPDDAPGLLLRQLHAQSQPQQGSAFLPLMTRVSDALLAGGDPVSLRQLNWSDTTLRLTVEASNLGALQQAEAQLTAAGLTVLSGSASVSDGAARAELTVQP